MSGWDEKEIQGSYDNLVADQFPRKDYTQIGKRGIRRIDGYEKASGHAIYTIDVQVPGMLHGRCLTCPYPHAEIVSMNTSKAEAFPGVRAVLRYDDPELPELADLGGHPPVATPPLLKTAHFEGEEVGAFVVADTDAIAEQAVKLIEVVWDIRPFNLTLDEAKKEGAPLSRPEESPDGNHYNDGFNDVIQQGDVEKGFQESDLIIEFDTNRTLNTWVGPERPCGVFQWNGEYPEIWVKQQRPYISKRVVSSWFGGIPMNKVQVHCPYQGASFGGWSQTPWNHGGLYCAGVVSRRLGKPVKFLFSRREDFYGGQMDEGDYFFKVGVKKDGTIQSVKVTGEFHNQLFTVFGVVQHFLDNTKIPHIWGRLKAYHTNKGVTVPTRCEQAPNTLTFTMVFDKVAAALGMDPIEVALMNDGAEGHDMEWLAGKKAELGFEVRDSLRECVEKGKKAIDWDNKWHQPGTKKLPNGKMHGMAFTWTHEWEDSVGTSEMAIRLEREDGTASILSQRADVGVNAETAYCQIAADEIGMKVEDVYYRPHNESGFVAMTPDSSTNLSINGFAIRHAARLLKRNILKMATSPSSVTQRGAMPAKFPDCEPDDLEIKDSVVYVKKDPSVRMTLAELVGRAGIEGPMLFEAEFGKGAPRAEFTVPLFAHAFHVQQGAYAEIRLRFCRQAHFMEVEVDTETGHVDVVKVVNANDVGKVISFEGCEGQQYGGSIMGVSRALLEEVVYDPITGVMLNGNLLDYKIATMLDVGEIGTELVETGMGYGPYGAIGIGEDVATVVPPLLAPAVFNALGVWVDEFPITPEKVLNVLAKAKRD